MWHVQSSTNKSSGKESQKGGDKRVYLEAKRMNKSTVYHAKKLAEKEKIQNLEKKEERITTLNQQRK